MSIAKPLVGIAAIFFAGCASSASSEDAKTPSGTEDDNLSSFSIPDMIGSPQLCMHATTLNLPDAAWASWFADAAYADINLLAKPLESYGFGNAGEGAQWLSEYSALLIAKLFGSPNAKAMNDALYATVHPDRGMEFFSVGSTQLTWANRRSDKVTILAFRGTFALNDALDDLDAFLAPGPLAGNVHEGFLAAEKVVEPLLDARLALLPKDQTVIVTGHSAGGALATLYVAHALEKGATQHFIVDTFGSPRVGDPTFADAFTAKMKASNFPVFRFHNGDDPVPNLPSEGFGFKHVGIPVHLMDDSVELDDTYTFQGIGTLRDHAKAKYFTNTTQRFLLQQPAYAVKAGGAFASATAASLSACK